MASFSLTEKLAVTGAFLAVVALLVGTEDDPGLVIDGQQAIKELRPSETSLASLAEAPQRVETPSEIADPQPSLADLPVPDIAATAASEPDEDAKQFNPELGRVPLDFSNGPPPT